MKALALSALLCFLAPALAAPATQPLAVDPGGHYFITRDGKPFFWLGDTAWELIHALDRDDIDYYLTTRARQGYTVIQTVALAELDGLTQPTPEGLLPFENLDPSKPNAAYFDKVAATVERARDLGLYVALLPSWGDKVTAPWGAGPRVFTREHPEIARAYGQFLGRRLRGFPNIIWMMGGDRPTRVTERSGEYSRKTATQAGFPLPVDWTPVWTAMVDGIRDGYGKNALFSYHPMGGPDGTALDMPDVPWLAINGRQSGHGGGYDVPIWEQIARDYLLGKPTLDLEPNYEDHPYNPWPEWDPSTGYFEDYDVRKQVYRSVFAGAAGVTYGHHSIWQFAGPHRPGLNHARLDWVAALHRPGGRQMQFLRWLVESRPMLTRIPDDTLIVEGQGTAGAHLVATRGRDGAYAFVYFPQSSQPATLDLKSLPGNLTAWWFDPRTGVARKFALDAAAGSRVKVRSPPNGPDWVLVLDDARRSFPPPGLPR